MPPKKRPPAKKARKRTNKKKSSQAVDEDEDLSESTQGSEASDDSSTAAEEDDEQQSDADSVASSVRRRRIPKKHFEAVEGYHDPSANTRQRRVRITVPEMEDSDNGENGENNDGENNNGENNNDGNNNAGRLRDENSPNRFEPLQPPTDDEEEVVEDLTPSLYFIGTNSNCVFVANYADVTKGTVAEDNVVKLPVFRRSTVLFCGYTDEDVAIERAKNYSETHETAQPYGEKTGNSILWQRDRVPLQVERMSTQEIEAVRGELKRAIGSTNRRLDLFEAQTNQKFEMLNIRDNVDNADNVDETPAAPPSTPTTPGRRSRASVVVDIPATLEVPSWRHGITQEWAKNLLVTKGKDFEKFLLHEMFTQEEIFVKPLNEIKEGEFRKIVNYVKNAATKNALDACKDAMDELISKQRKYYRNKMIKLGTEGVAMIPHGKPIPLICENGTYEPPPGTEFIRRTGALINAYPILKDSDGIAKNTMIATRTIDDHGKAKWTYQIATTNAGLVPAF